MNKKTAYLIYANFVLVYLALGVFNYLKRSEWILDNIFSVIVLSIIFMLHKWLYLGKSEFALLNIALLGNNLGTFGFYNFGYGHFYSYDNIIHLFNSIIGAYIFFNFIVHKVCLRKNKSPRKRLVDENKAVFFIFVISVITTIGAFVEVIEYTGFIFFGSGEGIFFTGAGDYEKFDSVDSQYRDTMGDVIVNFLGAIIGALIYTQSK